MRSGDEWLSVETNFAPRLIIGWRPRPRTLAAGLIDLHTETFDDLRLVAENTLRKLSSAEAIQFDYEALPEDGEEYIRRSLDDLRLPTSDGAPIDDSAVDDSAQLVQLVAGSDRLSNISASQLADGKFAFYCIAYLQTDGEMVGFVRAMNPARVLQKAAFWGRYTGSLRRVAKPDLMLESDIDIVVTGDELAILRRSAYDRLFSDLDELAAAVPGNVTSVVEAMGSLPLTPGAVAALGELGGELSSVARRLSRLKSVGGLSSLTPSLLRDTLKKHGEDPLPWFNESEEVTLDRSRAKEFIDLVEGRWWTSDFQGERRRADRFRRR